MCFCKKNALHNYERDLRSTFVVVLRKEGDARLIWNALPSHVDLIRERANEMTRFNNEVSAILVKQLKRKNCRSAQERLIVK